MSAEKAVSLADELEALADALDGVRLLVEALEHHQFGTDQDHHRAPRTIAANQVLLIGRVRQVRRVVRGHADAETIFTTLNSSIGDLDGNDVVLRSGIALRRKRR